MVLIKWTWKALPPKAHCVRIFVNVSKEAETWVQTVFKANFSSQQITKKKIFQYREAEGADSSQNQQQQI